MNEIGAKRAIFPILCPIHEPQWSAALPSAGTAGRMAQSAFHGMAMSRSFLVRSKLPGSIEKLLSSDIGLCRVRRTQLFPEFQPILSHLSGGMSASGCSQRDKTLYGAARDTLLRAREWPKSCAGLSRLPANQRIYVSA